MMKAILLLWISLSAFSCTAPLRNANLIVAGDGIGPYRLGITTREEVLADGYSLAVKDPLRLKFEFQFDEANRLEYISVHEPGWQTAHGIGVGSSLHDLLKAYPLEQLWLSVEPASHGGHIYWYPGMVVLVKNRGGEVIDDIYIMRFPQTRGR
ncbi:MAG: hypothetical protein COA70_10190 [Planctomycetota bacterium]|nr:MAG: hypothetical protein COA70_10190 [Planctomycetota bacterium]